MKNDRINALAYNLIRLLSSESAYQELTTFAGYMHRANGTESGEDRAYFERQASAMEDAATALMDAKDRVIAEYNQRLDAQAKDHENLFPWPGLREVQA